MKKVRKVIGLLCLSTFATKATTVTFDCSDSTTLNNNYFSFTLGENNSEIARISIKENFPDNNVMQTVTLVIPGETNINGEKCQTKIKNCKLGDSSHPFEGLRHKNLRIKVKFVSKNGKHVILPKYCEGMFYDSGSITEIDFSGIDNTPLIATTSCMFAYCDELKDINFTNFNVSNIKEVYRMFDGCKNLEKLNLSDFNTRNVTNMFGMFANCENLSTLDLSGFDIRNVDSMICMFCGCKKLTNLNLRNWNTRNVSTMQEMFRDCHSLTTVDLGHFKINHLCSVNDMFSNCYSLQYINNDELVKKQLKVSQTSNVVLREQSKNTLNCLTPYMA